jgi:hypothetical protein
MCPDAERAHLLRLLNLFILEYKLKMSYSELVN